MRQSKHRQDQDKVAQAVLRLSKFSNYNNKCKRDEKRLVEIKSKPSYKMKKIAVDTNIIFSTLLNSNGTIGDLIFNSDHVFEFYSCDYMRYEIRKHWSKLIKISKLSDEQLQ